MSTLSALSAGSDTAREPIAIIGVGCRFPGGIRGPRVFWQALVDGIDAITTIPNSRFDVERYYDSRPATPGKLMSQWGGYLEDVEQFDAYFFGISPREADRLDPQQRLLLEVAWEALEDAGQRPRDPALRETGVFAGIWLNDYEARLFHNPANSDFYMTTGSGRYAAAGRLSYSFGFQGPSLTVDTACSSSLVAVHLACQSLRSAECNLALAGGVNVILQPQITIAYSQSKMMAPDGRCKFGDARGDGYVRSEGAGVVVLKRLRDALADGDPIYAVIRGSAVNNDGRSSGFLATPGTAGQEDLLRKAYRSAGVAPSQVQYVEAHGTGTRAGDPVEIEALGTVLGEGRPAGQFCWVGSVKTNLGHTEGAAGVAGLIKVALALKHHLLPASLHFQTPNPAIPWERLPVRIAAETLPWPAHSGRATAGVSAFGIAGTNAHVVLEEAPVASEPSAIAVDAASFGSAYLLPLSAHTPAALGELVAGYRSLLAAPGAPPLADLAYTAGVRRTHQALRAAFVAASPQELAAQLAEYDVAAGLPIDTSAVSAAAARKVVFVFSGQGSQWLGMGRRLLATEAVFRAAMTECDQALRPFVNWSLLEQLAAPAEAARLDEISVIQPALFAIQVSLAALWRAWGVEPQAVIGHSLGEVAAACVAGALRLEDAARVICLRSRLMQEVSGKGAMAVVDLPLAAAEQAVAGEAELSVAVSNSPRSTVLSGEPAALQRVLERLQAQDIFCRLVKVDVAAHSPQMEPLRPRLVAALDGLTPAATSTAIFSTVSGELQAGEGLDAAYWGQNLRRPVLFATAVQAALAAGCNTFIEISPHPVLVPAIQQCFVQPDAAADDFAEPAALGSCRREEDEQQAMLRTLGALYTLGYPVDWHKLHPNGGRVVALPSYPWQRERFWFDNIPALAAEKNGDLPHSDQRRHPLLGWEIMLAGGEGRRVWENSLDSRIQPLLFEHKLHNTLLLPASALLGMAVAAAQTVWDEQPFTLLNVQFQRPLLLDTESPSQVQTMLVPQGNGYTLSIYSRLAGGEWAAHMSARLAPAVNAAPPPVQFHDLLAERVAKTVSGSDYYADLAVRGIAFGALQPVTHIRRGAEEALALFAPAEASLSTQNSAPFLWLDAALQVTPLATSPQDGAAAPVYVPASLAELRIYPTAQDAAAWAFVQMQEAGSGDDVTQRLTVGDAHGALIAELQGLHLVPLGQTMQTRPEDWLYKLVWQPQDLPLTLSHNEREVGRWIIFADLQGIGAALAEAIRQAGGAAVLVFMGDQFTEIGPEEYQLNPFVAEDMQTLFRLLFPHPAPECQGIIHLWSLNQPSFIPPPAGMSGAMHHAALAAALHMVQAVALRRWASAPKFWLVTQAAQQAFASSQDIALPQTPLWGLGRVLGVEHPDLRGGLIDLDPALPAPAAAQRLWAEMAAPSDEEVALGVQSRLVARLAPVEGANAPVWRCRPDATYLITGGLGDIGLLLAQWLVKQGARRLILMGRTPLPPRSEWTVVDPAGSNGHRIAAVRSLEAQGISLHIAAVDVGDENQLAAFLLQYQQEGWPPIRGVVHAAGIVRDRLLAGLTWPEMAEVLHAKVTGGWLLHKSLPDLDFFVLFSSLGALLGQPGQGSYAAANTFLDALAGQRRSQGLPALSVNWGPWAGVGFAALTGGQRVTQQLAQQGIGALDAAQGLAILSRLLTSDAEAQVAVLPLTATVSDSYMPRLLQELYAGQVGGGSASAAKAGGAAVDEPAVALRATLLALEPAQRRRQFAAYLQTAVARVLRMQPARIGLAAPLGSLGLDSLMALELRNRLESELAIVLPATFAWNYPTIQELLPYLAQRMELALEVQAVGQVVERLAAKEPETVPDQQSETEAADLDRLLAGLDTLSDESALDLLRSQ